MYEQIITTTASFAILLSILGFLIKRWMDKLEEQMKHVSTEVAKVKDEKLDKSTCKDFRVDEAAVTTEVWNWLKYHKHTVDGFVIVPSRD